MFPHGSALPELKMGHDLNKKRVLIVIQERERDSASYGDTDITTGKCQGCHYLWNRVAASLALSTLCVYQA